MPPLRPGPPAKTLQDEPKTQSVMSTNCLGCFVPEGAMHAEDCPGYEPVGPTRTLDIDLRKLIRSYGLEPRWASLDALGRLTVAGTSRPKE